MRRTIISLGLLIVVFALLAAQFLFPNITYGGGWCKSSLDAPAEQGFYTYQFKSYGFPIPIITVVKEECFSEPIITYELSPPGILVDGLLPVIAIFIWFRRDRVFRKQNEISVQEK